MAPLSGEQFESPLSEKELVYAKWYMTHQPLLYRVSVGVLIFMNVVLLTMLSVGVVRLMQSSSNVVLEQGLVSDSIVYDSFREVLQPQPLLVRSISVLASGTDQYDAIAEMMNPNGGWLADPLVLQFTTLDRVFEPMTTFLLPGESRLIPLPRTEGITQSTHVSVVVKSVQWKRIRGTVQPSPFTIGQPTMHIETLGPTTTASIIDTSIANTSPRGFWQAPFLVIVHRSEQLLGVRQVVLDRVKSGQGMTISARWLQRFPEGSTIDVVPVWNPFDEKNLLPLDLDRP